MLYREALDRLIDDHWRLQELSYELMGIEVLLQPVLKREHHWWMDQALLILLTLVMLISMKLKLEQGQVEHIGIQVIELRNHFGNGNT